MIINAGDILSNSNSINLQRRSRQFGIIFMSVLLVLFAVLAASIQNLAVKTINYVYLTVEYIQPWRIATSFLIPGLAYYKSPFLYNQFIFFQYLELIINLYFFAKVSYIVERTYSTAYLILNTFLQTIFFNTVIFIVYYPLIYFELISKSSIYTCGISSVVINFLLQSASVDQKYSIKLFCLNYEFNYHTALAAYILFISIIQGMFLGSPISVIFIYLFLAFYQHRIKKTVFFKLPLSVYRAFDCLMPSKIYESNAYTKVSNVETSLELICFKCCRKEESKSQVQHELQNQFNQQSIKKGETQKKSQQYWRNKYPEESNTQQKHSQSIKPSKKQETRQKLQISNEFQENLNSQSEQNYDKPLIEIQNNSQALIVDKKQKNMDYRQVWSNKYQQNHSDDQREQQSQKDKSHVEKEKQQQKNNVQQPAKQDQREYNDQDFT